MELSKATRKATRSRQRVEHSSGTVQSILKSGDGKSAKTAWFVVGLREELFMLGAALQVQSKEQHSVKQDGHYYSRIVVTDSSGKDAVEWFNIDTDIEMANRAREGHHIY
jgi:hypothetical protein